LGLKIYYLATLNAFLLLFTRLFEADKVFVVGMRLERDDVGVDVGAAVLVQSGNPQHIAATRATSSETKKLGRFKGKQKLLLYMRNGVAFVVSDLQTGHLKIVVC
jgi:hypothetical protein